MNVKSTRGDRRVRVGEVCAGYGGLYLGVSRTQQLKILGNGVVPQQAALALTSLHLAS